MRKCTVTGESLRSSYKSDLKGKQKKKTDREGNFPTERKGDSTRRSEPELGCGKKKLCILEKVVKKKERGNALRKSSKPKEKNPKQKKDAGRRSVDPFARWFPRKRERKLY